MSLLRFLLETEWELRKRNTKHTLRGKCEDPTESLDLLLVYFADERININKGKYRRQ